MKTLALACFALLSFTGFAHAAKVSAKNKAIEAAYTQIVKNTGGSSRTTFVKFTGAALTQFKKQSKTGDTQVFRLNGTSTIAKTTALISSSGEDSSRFAIVRLDKTGKSANKVIATGFWGANDLKWTPAK